jgi:hypothetical protein
MSPLHTTALSELSSLPFEVALIAVLTIAMLAVWATILWGTWEFLRASQTAIHERQHGSLTGGSRKMTRGNSSKRRSDR